ncbi:hypothetical protein OG401_41300 [Kitasatospora purpeofusca]|uniref:hypothetical protein n=1 Tax=Kitasatospora purpeofusca TaxID=67352 RepID=UPI00224F3BBC|nr:hypothetical protein [Kitasatospora purpeofusca]MCX4690658.1 hypothetical protein [Kitasatospora purpeofusca]
MSFSPGDNAANPVSEPMLFGGPTCTVCATELAWGGRGRRPKYCSKACSSRADRAREKEKQAQALAAATEKPRGETALPDSLADDPAATEILSLGEELLRHDRLLLLQLDRAARDSDPALARQAVGDVLHAADLLMRRHRELAEQLLAEHPTQTPTPEHPAPALTETPRGESRTTSGSAPATTGTTQATAPAPRLAAAAPDPEAAGANRSPRGETPTGHDAARPTETTPPRPVSPRGETATTADTPASAPAAPWGETAAPAPGPVTCEQAGPAAEAGGLRNLVDRHPAEQTVPAPRPAGHESSAGPAGREERTVSVPRDPLLRGLPRGMDVHVPLDPAVFGYSWQLAGWTVQPDVLVVLGEGHQVGWVERGLDGSDSWVAVCEGYFIGDPVTLEARLHATPEHAARTVHQVYLQNL